GRALPDGRHRRTRARYGGRAAAVAGGNGAADAADAGDRAVLEGGLADQRARPGRRARPDGARSAPRVVRSRGARPGGVSRPDGTTAGVLTGGDVPSARPSSAPGRVTGPRVGGESAPAKGSARAQREQSER